MAGRDAYLELGFNQTDNLSQTPSGEDGQRSNPIVNEAHYAQDPQRYTDHIAHRDVQAANPNSDFFAGLILILGILLIGALGGFFGRGFISPTSSAVGTPAVLGVQSVQEAETLASGASTEVVRFGTPHSDRMLGLERQNQNSALMLVGSSNGEKATKRWMTVSMDGATPSVSRAVLKDKNGVAIVPIATGGLVASSLSDETITLTHLRDGERQWSKDYPTLATSGSEIAIAPSTAGLVMLAPSEDSAFIRMASISADGFVAWESTFSRPENFLGSDIIVDGEGRIFAAITAASDLQPKQDLILFDDRGRLVADSLLPLFGDDQVVGMVAQQSGGIAALVSGSAPRLEYISSDGSPLQTVNLPQMQFQDNAQILPLENGELVIASTSTLTASQVQLRLEQRGLNGEMVAQRTVTLPADASVDAIVPASSGEFLISGSMREDRYAPTDLFVQRVGFSPVSHPVLWSEMESVAPTPLAIAETVELVSEEASFDLADSRVAVEPIEASAETPIIASLTLTPSTNAVDEAATESILVEEEPTTALAEDISVESAPLDADKVSIETTEPTSASIDLNGFDLNAAALSRFVGQDFTTLCRFTCVDTASGSIFPMTGTYLSAQVSNAKQAKVEHARICEAANLSPQIGSQPACGVN